MTVQPGRRATLRADFLHTPLKSRLPEDHPLRSGILELHLVAVRGLSPVYRDPKTGFSVFTAAFLAGRGYCCDSGCRHCPYEPERTGTD